MFTFLTHVCCCFYCCIYKSLFALSSVFCSDPSGRSLAWLHSVIDFSNIILAHNIIMFNFLKFFRLFLITVKIFTSISPTLMACASLFYDRCFLFLLWTMELLRMLFHISFFFFFSKLCLHAFPKLKVFDVWQH